MIEKGLVLFVGQVGAAVIGSRTVWWEPTRKLICVKPVMVQVIKIQNHVKIVMEK